MSKFKNKVLNIVRNIPKGKVASYGQVALIAGYPRGAQQAGWVLHVCGNEDGVCWWRVINNQGRISTKCTEHTPLLQKQLLEDDGVEVEDNLDIDIEKYRWKPSLSKLKTFELKDEYICKVQEKFGV